MASSVVQNLFDDAFDGLTPVKTCTAFLDTEDCNSPMMDYFSARQKQDSKAQPKTECTEAVPGRRCRTLRRTGTFSEKNRQSTSDHSLSNDDVTVTTRINHDIGSSLLLDEGSSDSGVRLDEDENPAFTFKVPSGIPSRQLTLFEEDACSPLSYSPVKPQLHPISFSLSSSDDGFFEEFAAVETDDNNGENLPGTFATLFKAPVLNTQKKATEEFQIKKPACLKVLNRLSSMEIRPRGGQKRQNVDDEEEETRFQKRRRAVGLQQRSCSEELPNREVKVPLKRYHSDTAAIINALDRVENNPDLIGDGTESFCLPTIPGKHQDLKSVTPETLAKVMNHEYDHIIEKFVIIDCRYPYEYQGGHIQGGQNYYTKEAVMENLMAEPLQSTDSDKRVTLIFHCEFSSERAPRMSRFLRNMDREQNKQCYPHLHYPEVYILHGGYKNFFESQMELCEPQTYIPMLHEDFKEDMRRFRIKTKSWAGDKKGRSARGRLGF